MSDSVEKDSVNKRSRQLATRAKSIRYLVKRLAPARYKLSVIAIWLEVTAKPGVDLLSVGVLGCGTIYRE